MPVDVMSLSARCASPRLADPEEVPARHDTDFTCFADRRACEQLLLVLRATDTAFDMAPMRRDDGVAVMLFVAPGEWGCEDISISLEPAPGGKGWLVLDPITLHVFGKGRTAQEAAERASSRLRYPRVAKG